MPERTRPSFPPLGDESRFDAIVHRGRLLRRRRRAGVSAGAGSAVAAAVVAVVLLTGTSPSGGDPVIADRDDVPAESTTTTTEPAPPSTGLQVEIVSADEHGIEVTVDDPARPVARPEDEPAKQCVALQILDENGNVVAEGYPCADPAVPGGTATSELTWIPPGGAQIGCAAIAVRVDAVERTTEPASSTFEIAPPDDLPVGTYSVEVTALSGIGDGCPGTTDGTTEQENEQPADPAELTIP